MFKWLKQLFGAKNDKLSKLLAENHPIIDVRTSMEFSQGHAEGSINIPLNDIGQSTEKIKQMSQPVIMCCKSGARSMAAVGLLKKQGIQAINGGSWQNVERHKS